MKSAGQTYGQLLVDNNNNAGAVTPINETITFDHLTVQNKAKLSVTTGTTITTPTATVSGGDLNIESSAVLDVLSLALESSSTLVLASGSNLSPTDLLMSSSTITNHGSLTWTTVTLTGTNTITNNGQLDVPELTVVNLTLYQKGSLHIADNSLTIDAYGVFVLDVPLEIGSITINSGGALTHSAGEAGLDVTVTGDLTVNAGGAITVNGKGYGSDSGPGAGGSSCGGGYGGAGGGGAGGSTYGSITAPSDLGSGGGSYYAAGGAGGGAIRLTVGGMLTVDGSLTANGNDGEHYCTNWCTFHYYGAGGSGGSIWVIANELTGTGVISANGGNTAGGGGGGRIAAYYNASTYTGNISAHGGTGSGGAGTIYLKSAGQTYGQLLVDNNNTAGAVTPLNESITLDDLDIRNAAKLDLMAGTTTATPIATLSGATLHIASGAVLNTQSLMLESSSAFTLDSGCNLSLPNLSLNSSTITNNGSLTWTTVTFTGTNTITNNGQLDVPELTVVNLTLYQKGSLHIADNSLTIDANGVFVLDVPLEIGGITINSGGALTHSAGEAGFDLTVTGDLTVAAGGSISADGKGYGSDSGPGAGGGSGSYGGSYGGVGGYNTVGPVYGSITAPSGLGSGGGRSMMLDGLCGWGGAGGGVIRLNVVGTLTVDGSLTANGNDGGHACYLWCSRHLYGGGGSGGSILLITLELTGTGVISANGGGGHGGDNWDHHGSGGGGGGRIAVYDQTSTFSGIGEAKGGTGGANGEDGTVVMATQGSSLESPATVSTLSETTFTESTLIETLLRRKATLNNAVVTGDLNGTLDFTNFEMVSIQTGSFAGKGFSRGEWQANLEGVSYAGNWEGFAFLDGSENKIYLKGAISGGISGIVEGYLAESTPGTGIYDQYQATWKFGRLGSETFSGTINLAGDIVYQESYVYPSTELYVLQSSIQGTTFGHYTGPLNTVLTHLSVADGSNPYYGQGFSIISYVSESGAGQGYTYDQLVSFGRVELRGLFTSPLNGIVSATLDESQTPRTLFLTLERIDLGLPAMADLKVKVWGPNWVSPGQTINYIIEYRNDGVDNAENVLIVDRLPIEVDYISSTDGGIYIGESHEVIWKLGTVPAKSIGSLAIRVTVQWGLPAGTELGVSVEIGTTSDEVDTYLDPKLAIYNIEDYLIYEPIEMVSSRPLTTGEFEQTLEDQDALELFNYLEENGYENMIASWEAAFNDASEYVISLMTSNSGDRIGALISSPSGQMQPLAMGFTETNYTFSDRGGGITYDVVSDNLYTMGAPHNCGYWERMNDCLYKKFGVGAFRYGLKTLLGELGAWILGTWDLANYQENLEKCWSGELNTGQECIDANADVFRIVLAPLLGPVPGATIVPFLSCAQELYVFPDKYLRCIEGQQCLKCGRWWTLGLPNNIESYECKDCLWAYHDEGSCESYANQICKQVSECWAECKDPKNMSVHAQQVLAAGDPNVKYGPEGYVQPGQKLDYKVEYENEGEGIAFGVYVTDVLDEDLSDATLVINNGGIYNPPTRTITWFIGQVDPHQGDSVSFSANIRSDAPEGTDVINYATVYFPSVPEITRTNGVVSIIAMFGAICGDVTHDNGNPVANVTVKVIDSENNQVGDPIVTGSDGTFYFDSLLMGTYSVMIVSPLGYSVSPGETQTGIEVTGYPCTEVNFVLTPIITSNDCRTIGYWKHQFDVYLSGRGNAQESSTDLEHYLDLVHLHFDVLGIYTDLENFDFVDAKNVLTVSGGRLMLDRAKQQLFALLLNFASGKIGNETVVSEDGRVAAEAVTYVASLIKDGNPANDELAKTICDLINNRQMVEAGIIPKSSIRYRATEQAGLPIQYNLNQNYPNPFNPVTQIRYALPTAGHVRLEIYNLLGQKVATLVDEDQQAGQKTVNWEAKNLASGIYFYKLTAGDFTATKKMVLTK